MVWVMYACIYKAVYLEFIFVSDMSRLATRQMLKSQSTSMYHAKTLAPKEWIRDDNDRLFQMCRTAFDNLDRITGKGERGEELHTSYS